jgi:acetyl-CoA C-acetyltransferase
MNKAIYITHAKRTAIGAFMGSLSNIPAYKLGATVMKSILTDNQVSLDIIDEVILGHVLTSGAGQNPTRQAAIMAGIPKETPSFTINKVCGSGLKSVCLAAQSIISGDNEIVIAGGQENMSMGIHGAYIRSGHKLGVCCA